MSQPECQASLALNAKHTGGARLDKADNECLANGGHDVDLCLAMHDGERETRLGWIHR